MEDCLEVLQSHIVCRKKEISTLYSLLSSKTSMPQSIFTLGHSGTGKSLVIRSVLEYLKYNFAIINCIENPTVKHLLERIIIDLWHNTCNTEIDHVSSTKCNNMFEFIIQLNSFASANDSNIVIVFENCNRLRNLDATILPALLRLQELSKVNVCTIFVTDIVWEKFKIKNEMFQPIKIYFSQYNFQEVYKILLKLESDNNDIDIDIYETYLDLFLSVYYRFCRDLNELHYMARLNFKKYIEPINSGKCQKTDNHFLWRNIMNIFKSNLEVIYLRISADELATREEFARDIDCMRKLVVSFELPYYSQYLLVAAFLASYIPPKMDKKLFRIESTKRKKKASAVKKTNSLLTAAPHAFNLDRMLGIFCYIVDEEVDVNAILLTQISTLCRLGLLTPIGINKLDESKYKCCVDIDFMIIIAKMINCNIQDFLNAI